MLPKDTTLCYPLPTVRYLNRSTDKATPCRSKFFLTIIIFQVSLLLLCMCSQMGMLKGGRVHVFAWVEIPSVFLNHFLSVCLFILRQGLSLTLEVINSLDCLTLKPQGSPCPCSFTVRIIVCHVPLYQFLYAGTNDLNSDPLVCSQSILFSEPFPTFSFTLLTNQNYIFTEYNARLLCMFMTQNEQNWAT